MDTHTGTQHVDILRRRADGWTIEPTLASTRAEYMDLFGTVEIPTPFMASVGVDVVLARLQQLNPTTTYILEKA